ncbi:fluconazole resistance protein 1 [Trichomonascus vanleenenianus]|uniref:MFS transporter n=1 Tax=Trichomonascus vanleenenianus TaxID=2268995 RepID=UPI003EC9EF19
MVSSFFRDSFWGRLIYHLSGKKLLIHPEEEPGYVIPDKYLGGNVATEVSIEKSSRPPSEHQKNTGPVEEAVLARTGTITTVRSLPSDHNENENDNSKQESSDGSDEYIMVTWEGDNDPENPYNWALWKKVVFILQIGILTVSIYMGSSIYTPGFVQIQQDFHVSQVVSILPLAVFVMGYGLGPMFWSPFSENPAVGRTNIYVLTLLVFVALQIPTALAKNIGSLLVLRFLAGFFASPALATGGASVGDVVTIPRIPIGLASWGISAVCGPVFGPFIGGVFSQLLNWRWTFWFLLMMSGSSLFFLSFMLPETNNETLLYRKAKRLRKLTGNPNIISNADLYLRNMSAREMAIDTLWRPIEITLTEPVVFLIDLYIGLVYSIFYTFFEAFPIVLEGIHHFNSIEMGLSYLGIMIGVLIGAGSYIPYIHRKFTIPLESGTMVTPEVFIPPAIVGASIMPVGMLIFAWSSTASAHWIGPIIGGAVFSIGGFTIFQTLFNYMAFSFPKYMASVFASNGLFRAGMACAFPLFANAMYRKLGPKKFPVGWGCTLLAGLCVLMILIPVFFNKYGVKLRARSKYAN